MRKSLSITIIFILFWGINAPSIGGVFDTAEYQSRRAKLMTSIPDGIAVFLGAAGSYQNSNFLYFTGIEEPFSVLIIDGIRKRSVLFMTSVESNAKVIEETGVDRVLPL